MGAALSSYRSRVRDWNDLDVRPLSCPYLIQKGGFALYRQTVALFDLDYGADEVIDSSPGRPPTAVQRASSWPALHLDDRKAIGYE
jgi:hypothetical protein